MVQKIVITAIAMATSLGAQASHQCTVQAEDPATPGLYNQLLETKSVDLSAEVFMYLAPSFYVTAASQDGVLVISSNRKLEGKSEINALGTAKASSLTVIDGKNKILINCYQK